MRLILLLFVLLSTWPWTRKSMVIIARPFLQIVNQHPKCLEVESYPFFTLNIKYHAVDLIVLPRDDSEQHEEMKIRENPEEVKEHLDMQKLDNLGYINRELSDFTQKDPMHESDMHDNLSSEHFESDLTLSISLFNEGTHINIMAENILKEKGRYSYNMEANGIIKICIQSLYASKRNPTLFGIDVIISQMANDKNVNIKKESDVRNNAFNIMTSLMDELNKLKVEAKAIQNTSRQKQINIKKIRKRIEKLHQSYILYPTVQMIVFIISFFLQVRYLSNYWNIHSSMT